MAQNDRQKARCIFMDVADLPASDRAAAIECTCGGDTKLRAEVEALLRANGQAGGFMESPTSDNGDASVLSMHFDGGAPTPNEQAGKQIGPYKLLEKIGEGGFGTVWMAEQREPVKRRVAIKLIKLGMDTKQVIARFEAERQALAMMDHPNIAKVLDAGSTEVGRPYFVMEYIRGIPILEYCDQDLLDTKARLALFTDVCHAIQHAHHKGIIHRDIKPTNVLVTMHDGVPVPKVIDFGIAKATNSELTTKTLFTEHRQMIGTPAYMSPEQAEMSALDIDTRSDIYSLGVLLYELLTGTTPFDVYDLRVKGYEEMLRIIREDEPHKPSTRVSTLGEDGAQAAKHRRAHDPKRLSGILRGDLDWIVMKCLEKDRTRRYETPNGLAADVQRHLKNEPVTAGAPSAAYKLRKFVRRNRGTVVAASLVAGTLILGVIGTTGGMLWANTERDRASDAKSQADLAATSESVAKIAAQQSAEKARAAATRATTAKEEEASARKRAEAISEFMVTALRSSDAQNAGGSQGMTILAAMDSAIADLDSGRFKDDPDTESGLKATIGVILRNNGRLQQAEALLTQVLETRRRLSSGDNAGVAWTMNELAITQKELGRTTEAKELFVATMEMEQRHLHGDHPALSRGLVNLAGVSPPEEAEPLLRQALAMDRRLHHDDCSDVAKDLGNLGSVLRGLGRTEEADALFAEALAMSQRMHEGDDPYLSKALDNLAKTRLDLGHPEEAVDLFARAVAMQQRMFHGDHPELARGLSNLAVAQQALGRFAEADVLFVQVLEMRQRLFPGDHESVPQVLIVLADLRQAMGRLAEAEQLAAQALAMNRRLHQGDHADLAMSMFKLGCVVLALDRAAEAEALLLEALAMYRRVVPGDSKYQALFLDKLGFARKALGRLEESEAVLAEALAMRRRIYKGDDRNLAMCINNLAAARSRLGRHAEAEALATESLNMWRRLYDDDRPEVAGALKLLAVTRFDSGHPAEAEAPAVQALEMYQRLRSGDDRDVALGLFDLARVRAALGRLTEAESLHEKAMAMNERQLPADHENLLTSRSELALVSFQLGKIEKATALYEEVLKRQLATLGRRHRETLKTIGNLGVNYAAAGRLAEGLPLVEEAYREGKQYPELSFIIPQVVPLWSSVADPRKPEDVKKVAALAREVIGDARATMPPRGPELAGMLASCGLGLLTVGVWDDAEALLREALTIREKSQPDAWRTFNTKSILGGALLGQKKLAEAEPLLLAGYGGMKEREATIEPNGRVRIPEALERLVKLYEAQGNASEATAWRSKLEAARATESRPSTRESKR